MITFKSTAIVKNQLWLKIPLLFYFQFQKWSQSIAMEEIFANSGYNSIVLKILTYLDTTSMVNLTKVSKTVCFNGFYHLLVTWKKWRHLFQVTVTSPTIW